MFSLFTVVKSDKELEEENKRLKKELKELKGQLQTKAKTRLDRLKGILETIPSGARGKGSILVYENEDYKTLEFETKDELVTIADRAEKGELEIVFV